MGPLAEQVMAGRAFILHWLAAYPGQRSAGREARRRPPADRRGMPAQPSAHFAQSETRETEVSASCCPAGWKPARFKRVHPPGRPGPPSNHPSRSTSHARRRFEAALHLSSAPPFHPAHFFSIPPNSNPNVQVIFFPIMPINGSESYHLV